MTKLPQIIREVPAKSPSKGFAPLLVCLASKLSNSLVRLRARAQFLFDPHRRVTGFTLVETFIAIFILTFAIGGPIAIAQKGLQSAILSRDRITASFLAMDALEYIRYERDSNFFECGNNPLAPVCDDWLLGVSSCLEPILCRVDTLTGAITVCSTDEDCQLYQETNGQETGRYGHTTGGTYVRSNFNRSFSIVTPIGDGVSFNSDEALVRVWVTWKTGIHEREILLQDHLFRWQ